MKKHLSLLLALSLCLSFCACTVRNEAPVSADEDVSTPEAAVANPMKEVSAEAILQDMGLDMSALSSYDHARFYIYDSRPKIAEAQFRFEGRPYRYRMATPAAETDISGMYYSDVQSTSATVSGRNATVRIGNEGGEISWYDLAPGIQYCLLSSEAVGAETLKALAEKLFVPVQGEVEAETAASSVGVPLQNLLFSFRDEYRPGSSGSSLVGVRYAAAMADLFTETTPTAEEVSFEVLAFSAMLSPEDRVSFAAQLPGVEACFADLAANGIEVLESAGASASFYPWDNDSISALFKAMTLQGSEGAYALRLSNYADALRFGMNAEELEEMGMNPMVKDMVLDEVGYAYEDLDNDGVKELIFGTIADDAYLHGLVLELCTVDAFGGCSQVFMSGERDRLYTMDGALFHHQGSNGADDSFDKVEKYSAGELHEQSTEGSNHVPRELIPLSLFG